jgi:epoxyqueuosine reductase QueG
MPFRARNANAQALARNASAADVKRRALELGADLAGIASAATLNAFPPDPRWPQTPERILPSLKSVIVLVQRIPAGAFRAVSNVPVQYMDMLVLRKMDKVAYRLADELERAGHPTFVTAAQETDWNLKRASYGRLSTRHLGVEAGLGTLGLEVNILTPEFGPRIYLTGVLTELELEPDQRITEQVCIGESCSRCLHSCPPNAVLHWGIDKRGCATEAQEFGFMTMLQFMERVIDASPDQRSAMLKTRDLFGFWQGLLRVVGSFGDCPRCLAVCPVGNDYHAHLADVQKVIPERTPEKNALQQKYKDDRKSGAPVAGLSDWNRRWVGEEGYKGMVAKQLQEFKRRQREQHGNIPETADSASDKG